MGNTIETIIGSVEDINILANRPNLHKEKHIVIIHHLWLNNEHVKNTLINISTQCMQFVLDIRKDRKEKIDVTKVKTFSNIILINKTCKIYINIDSSFDEDDMECHWNSAIGTLTI